MKVNDWITPWMSTQKAIFDLLRTFGYTPGTSDGSTELQQYPAEPVWGMSVLGAKSSERRKEGLIGLFRPRAKRYWVATIWFDHPRHKANHDTNWVIEVYGTANLEPIQRLAADIESSHDKTVKVILQSHGSRVEADYLPPW